MTILIFLFLMASSGWAFSDSFSGQIIKIDKVQGLMLVEQFRARSHGMHMDGHGMGAVKIAVFFLPESLPDFVQEGRMIRFKGQFIEGTLKKFRAEEFLPFEGLSNDPTGVRERLLKHSSCSANDKCDR